VTVPSKIYTLDSPQSFSGIVARNLYPEADIYYLNSNSELVERVCEGERVLVAIENSVDSIVGETLRSIRERENVFVTREIYYPVVLCLGGVKSDCDAAETERSLKVVYSYPKALNQCSRYLRHLKVNTIPTSSTTEAVRIVKELNDPSAGVIASEEAIVESGLELLKVGVQDVKDNYTVFWELSSRKGRGERTSLIADLKNKPGALYKFLEPFYEEDINLYAIHSWPKNSDLRRTLLEADVNVKPALEYWFLLKVEASEEEIPFEKLEKRASRIRSLGSYDVVDYR